jgi:hypothetical protein
MLTISKTLVYYKREDVRKEMIEHAKNKEVAARFNEQFGKRPDILKYSDDILEFAKNKATSFHCSEELWDNPLVLEPGMRKEAIDEQRIGWDFVLDIDCPYWEYSKLITALLIKALKKHGIKSISCKFSGNKGFHIGIPFEAFPDEVHGQEIRLLFPEGVRRLALYLIYYIDSKETDFELSRKILEKKSIKELEKELGKKDNELVKKICKKCGTKAKNNAETKTEFICPKCNTSIMEKSELNFKICERCNKIMEKREITGKNLCEKCKGNAFIEKFDTSAILNVDTVLISSRHMYRMPYSLHEKSGLASVPINIDQVMEFDKKEAEPEKLKVDDKIRFIDRRNVKKGEAANLIIEAFDFNPAIELEKKEKKKDDITIIEKENLAKVTEEAFPVCIRKGSEGMEDGRKRFSFVLINFLSNLNWDDDKIEAYLIDWNKKNKPPLNETTLLSQIRYRKGVKRALPPNCGKEGYYKDLQICSPDNLCAKIKNPVNYTIVKSRNFGKKKK